jgi:CRISPR-associated protein Cas1
MAERLIIKLTRDTLPQVKDKYPFLYLERGRLEIDDSSVKWIDSTGNVVRLPVATISCILLGPGTSITHEAVKVLSGANCSVCWVGEDSMKFYASGVTPTANTRNFRKQMLLAADPEKSLDVARRMFSKRFPKAELKGKTLKDMMGMEGLRVRQIYLEKAKKYNIYWTGRGYTPGKFELSDLTNQILTATNTALYAIVTSAVIAMGYSPHIGFIHSGSPLPFVYDITDLYKEELCVDLAFAMTVALEGEYNRTEVTDEFIRRVQEYDLLGKIGDDIISILGDK